ncbi:unnamed protein product [Owenia fusiformis]|uniref:Sulfotransferase domain-containing protein n=1 Tax=Owenia fusiformis TaxID=6347 RepID=A0A8S4Q063_OWEFU|nr:unnamed protein product [Owenia fusiformis]
MKKYQIMPYKMAGKVRLYILMAVVFGLTLFDLFMMREEAKACDMPRFEDFEDEHLAYKRDIKLLKNNSLHEQEDLGEVDSSERIFIMPDPPSDKTPHLSNVVIIGATNCGTLTLRQFLGLNHHIQITEQPTVCYFKKNFQQNGDEWYLEQMPYSSAEDIVLESCPYYFSSKEVPETMYKFNPNLKLLLIVCDPIQRLFSRYTDMKLNQRINVTLAQFILNKHTNQVQPYHFEVRYGLYAEHLKKFLNAGYNLSQVHVIDGDKFKVDPVSELKRVEDFLHIENVINNSMVYYDDIKGYFCMLKWGLEVCMPKGKGKLKSNDKETLSKLSEFYKMSNEQFFELIGQRFPWK